MSDLGHGALCACPQCQYARAELAKQRELGPIAPYSGKHRRRAAPKDAVLLALVMPDLNFLNDWKVLARGLMPADNEPKGDDLI